MWAPADAAGKGKTMTMTEPLSTTQVARTPAEAWWRRAIRGTLTLPLLLTVAYLIVGGSLLARHGLWRDEAQAFLIARDSPTLRDMFAVTQYEGHPPLWHILLWLLTRVTVAPEAMQWLHLLMGAGSVYLVARFAPFPTSAKVLFAFGYFPLFEYGIIARNYQLFMLLTFAFCALWQQYVGRGRRPFVWLAIVLFLLCFTHVAGVILAGGLGVMLLLDSALTRDGWRAIRRNWLQFPLAIAIAVFGAWLAVKVLTPPPDENFGTSEWRTQWDAPTADSALSTLWYGYVPIPQWGNTHFWNSNFLEGGGPSSFIVKPPPPRRPAGRTPAPPPSPWPWGAPATRGMAIGLAAVALMLLLLSWRGIAFFLVSTLGLLAFTYSKFQGSVRHDGAYFVALVAAFWIAWTLQRGEPQGCWRAGRRLVRAIPRAFLMGLLSLHVIAGYVACYYAWNFTFSGAREAAAALRSQLTADDQLMGWRDPPIASIAAYLPGLKFWLPESSRWGTFTIWKQMPSSPSGPQAARDLADRTGKPVVLVNGESIGNMPNAKFLGAFHGDIVDDENYYIYRIMPVPRGTSGRREPTREGVLDKAIHILGF